MKRLCCALTSVVLSLGCTDRANGPDVTPLALNVAGGPAQWAEGSAHWVIEFPNPFGGEVGNRTLSFNARKTADGEVSGRFEYQQLFEGEVFKFNVRVTCVGFYDGNRAKIGGVVELSSDPTEPPGVYAWFQVFDNGEGVNAVPDQSSLVGFGDEAANEAFCNSSRLPRFGPWDVEGNIQVRG
jgi:hypothetical protein